MDDILKYLITEKPDTTSMNEEDSLYLNVLVERHNNHILSGGDWRTFSVTKELQDYFNNKQIK